MADRRTQTRALWLEVLARHRSTQTQPDFPEAWSARYDLATREEILAIQNEKLAALTPFLYENSPFYRRRFDRLGLLPTDIRTVDDLVNWPVVTKDEMSRAADEYPPFGDYLTVGAAEWADRGWMQFSTSGSTGKPRPFRYTQTDRQYWVWANKRALYAMGIRRGETVFAVGGFGPHVWLWGVVETLVDMGIGMIPGGGLDGTARARVIERFQPTVLACTTSYALYLGRTLQAMGIDPATTAVHTLFLGGEPGVSVSATRTRLEKLWNARIVEFYGCTEASPHVGGFSCAHSTTGERTWAHLMEDVQIWETVDLEGRPVPPGERGLTVCTSLNSESSPQLRFLVGDYTTLERTTCPCGRSHARALDSFQGRADDVINLRGIKFFPSQIEEAVRTNTGAGDEFEILLQTNPEGLDTMTVRIEHPSFGHATELAEQIAHHIRSRCEVRCAVEILAPDTLPKTEFKARRVRDLRQK